MTSKHVAFVVGLLAIGACGSSGSPGNTADAGTIDGSPSVPDAASTHPDSATGGTPDATVITTPDATPSDAAPPQPVTVTVYDLNAQTPSMGLPVAFLNADNTVVLEVLTDANGSASATMAAGGSVTVGAAQVGLDLNGNVSNVYTWLGVKPGDNLVANVPVPPTAATQITVNFTTPTDTNAVKYGITGFCADGETFSATAANGGPTAIMAPSTCTTADVFVAAVANNSTELDTSYQANVALSDGAMITLGALDPAVTDSVMVSNAATQFNNISGTAELTDGTHLFGKARERFSELMTGASSASAALGSMANVDLLSSVSTIDSNDAIGQELTVITRGPSVTTGITLDFSTLSIATMQTIPVYDMPSSSFMWTESGTGTADFANVTMGVESTDQTRNYQWTIVGPHTDASLVLPTLPASLTDFTILSTDTITNEDAFTGQITGGYDAIRATSLGTNNAESQFRGTIDVSVFPSGNQYVEADVFSNN